MTTQPNTSQRKLCADGPCENTVGEDGVYCAGHAHEHAKRYAETPNP